MLCFTNENLEPKTLGAIFSVFVEGNGNRIPAGAPDAVTAQSLQVYCQQMMQWTALLQMMAHMPPAQQQAFMQMLMQVCVFTLYTHHSSQCSASESQQRHIVVKDRSVR